MKKMLTLVLILAVASLANATNLTWSTGTVNLAVNASQTVQLIASDALAYEEKWVGNDPSTKAQILSITKKAAAGSDAVVTDYTSTFPGWWGVQAVSFLNPSDVQAGAQYDVVVKGLAIGTYVVGSDAYGQNASLTINVIPEPITMALLGLGGLFIRKRK